MCLISHNIQRLYLLYIYIHIYIYTYTHTTLYNMCLAYQWDTCIARFVSPDLADRTLGDTSSRLGLRHNSKVSTKLSAIRMWIRLDYIYIYIYMII